MKRPEVLQGKRMLLDRDEMQSAAARGVAAPRLPGGEEVQAEAESGLEDDEALAPGPARRKVVAGEEYMPRLRVPAAGAVVDVAERLRVGDAFLKSEAGGGERLGHALLCVQRHSAA